MLSNILIDLEQCCGMVQQVELPLFLMTLGKLVPLDQLSDAETQISCYLICCLTEVTEVHVPLMPKHGSLLKALLIGIPEGIDVLVWLLHIECLSTPCYKYNAILSLCGVLSAMKMISIFFLKIFQVGSLSMACHFQVPVPWRLVAWHIGPEEG